MEARRSRATAAAMTDTSGSTTHSPGGVAGTETQSPGRHSHGRLEQMIPSARAFLDAAFARGESAGGQAKQLSTAGGFPAAEVEAAVREAIERQTPGQFGLLHSQSPPSLRFPASPAR